MLKLIVSSLSVDSLGSITIDLKKIRCYFLYIINYYTIIILFISKYFKFKLKLL